MSDEELDRLFRDSAESFDPPFDPEAWKAMDQKLDKTQGSGNTLTRSSLVMLLVLLFCSILVTTLLYKPGTKHTESHITINDQRSSLENGKANKTIEPNSDIEASNRAGNQSSEKAEQFISKEEVGSTVRLNNRSNKNATTQLRKRRSTPILGSFSENKPKSATQADKVQSESDQTDKSANTQDILEDAALSPAAADSTKRTDSSEKKAVDDVSKVDSLDKTLKKPLVEEEAADSKTDSIGKDASQQTEDKSHFLNHVQVAIAIAPDLTTVKFKHPDGVSVNAGFMLAVPFTRKLSLVSGVLWANKVYSVSGKEYSYSGGAYGASDEIYGTCKVLDIPLNLRYQLLEWGKNALALQAGVSSYIMLSEEYSSAYTYNSYGNPGTVTTTWGVENKNKHWFKVQNVSFSYTRSLSPAFSLGVEPFVKMPYTGIGEGKVKLTSAGIFFSTGYKLNLK